jgi:hypothetical protein
VMITPTTMQDIFMDDDKIECTSYKEQPQQQQNEIVVCNSERSNRTIARQGKQKQQEAMVPAAIWNHAQPMEIIGSRGQGTTSTVVTPHFVNKKNNSNETIDGADQFLRDPDREYVSIHDDTYNMFFLSNIGGSAFWYSMYIFALKMTMFTVLLYDAIDNRQSSAEDGRAPTRVLVAQFLMLPVAVSIQDDLMSIFYVFANLKYCNSVRAGNPAANKLKFQIATLSRAIDGFYSLAVNFMILVSATEVLSVFLNFAALMFLQNIDNIAVELAAQGFLTDRLEAVALEMKLAELPKRRTDHWMKTMDTVCFLGTVSLLMVLWCLFAFGDL